MELFANGRTFYTELDLILYGIRGGEIRGFKTYVLCEESMK